MSQILVLKLSSGEELIGTVYTDVQEYQTEHGDSNNELLHFIDDNVPYVLIIHVPVQIMYAPGQGLGMLPFQHYTEKHTLVLNKDCIVNYAIPAKELLDGYTSKFIHGISLVKKPGLIV